MSPDPYRGPPYPFWGASSAFSVPPWLISRLPRDAMRASVTKCRLTPIAVLKMSPDPYRGPLLRAMKGILLPLCCAFGMFKAASLQGAPGDLDPSWGGTGIVTTTFPGGASDDAFALSVQPDG